MVPFVEWKNIFFEEVLKGGLLNSSLYLLVKVFTETLFCHFYYIL